MIRRAALVVALVGALALVLVPSSLGGTDVLGPEQVTRAQARTWAIARGASHTFSTTISSLVWRYAPERGVVPEVAYALLAHETGFGRFGGVLDPSFRNPCGMKRGGGGGDRDPGAHMRFPTWDVGVIACLDHLALYAGSTGYPLSDTPDQRHFGSLLGDASTVERLGGRWAPAASYGRVVAALVAELRGAHRSIAVPEAALPPSPRSVASVGPGCGRPRVQLNRAAARGWLGPMRDAERAGGLPPGLLLALASARTCVSDPTDPSGYGPLGLEAARYPKLFARTRGAPSVEDAAGLSARVLRSFRDRAKAAGAARPWTAAVAAFDLRLAAALAGAEDDAPVVLRRQARFAYLLKHYTPGGPFEQPPVELDARWLVASHGTHRPVRIVLHSTESSNAPGTRDLYGVAAYWHGAGTGYGSHIADDCEGNTARYVDDGEVAWHVAARNTGSLGVEQIGTARWTRAQWFLCRDQLAKTAQWIAFWSVKYGIPIVHDPERGVSTHADQTRYAHVSGGHTDPGAGYPLDWVLARARQFVSDWRSR